MMSSTRAWGPLRFSIALLSIVLAIGAVLVGLCVVAAGLLLLAIFAPAATTLTSIAVCAVALLLVVTWIGYAALIARGASAGYRWSTATNRRALVVFALASLSLAATEHEIFPSSRASPAETSPERSETRIGTAKTAAFDDCITRLHETEDQKVQLRLQLRFRLSKDDAYDIAHDAMINVCTSATLHAYDNLGAVFWTAAEHRAIDDWKRRQHLRCVRDDEPLVCKPQRDEHERIAMEDAIVDAARCRLSKQEALAIYLRVHDGMDFAAIGTELGVSADKARSIFHNSVDKLRRILQDRCGP
jgi:DNA-directed RNA polymerase specialized sigma24 family protein